MIVTLMLYGLVAGGLIGLAAVMGERVLRLLRLPVRWVWTGALVAMIAMVGTAQLRAGPGSGAEVGGGGAGWGADAVVASFGSGETPDDLMARLTAALSAVPLGRLLEASEAVAIRAAGALGSVDAARWSGSLTRVWALSTALLFLLFGWTVLRSSALRRRWPMAEVEGLRARVSPDVGPAVMGVLRPEIIVPRWLLEASLEERRLALHHEREHVRGRDQLHLALGYLAAALVPWNPAAWWAVSRLRLAVELDCDARVLRAGAQPLAYGSILIDIAGRAGSPLAGATALGGRRSHLERRLFAMSENRRSRPIVRATGLALVTSGLLLAACQTPLPTVAEIEAMDVAAVEGRAADLLVGDAATEVAHVVDGVVVSAAAARALPADEILSIEVVRGEPGAPATRGEAAVVRREIRVATRAAASSDAATDTLPDRLIGLDDVRVHVDAASDAGVDLGPDPIIFVDGVRVDGVSADGPPRLRAMRRPAAPSAAARPRQSGPAPAPLDARLPDRPRAVAPVAGARASSDAPVASPPPLAAQDTIPPLTQIRGLVEQPLVVIDGVVQETRELPDLNRETIESIEVLKGPAAIRIYGDEGRNGVIRITTKSEATQQ